MKPACIIVMLIVLGAAASVGFTKPKSAQGDISIPFEEIGLFDPLPAEVADAPPEFRFKWIRAYNEMAVLQAQRRADAYRASNPVLEVYTQDQEYVSGSSLNQQASGDYNSAQLQARTQTTYQGRNVQRTYRPDQWGGGPVTILNPYTEVEVEHE